MHAWNLQEKVAVHQLVVNESEAKIQLWIWLIYSLHCYNHTGVHHRKSPLTNKFFWKNYIRTVWHFWRHMDLENSTLLFEPAEQFLWNLCLKLILTKLHYLTLLIRWTSSLKTS
jgi:hypothetical protein